MADSDLFDDEEYRMMGTAFVDAEPLPPGLDWDYFGPRPGFDDAGELGDTENPAIEAVFDWGNPLIGRAEGGRAERLIGGGFGGRVRRPNFPDQLRACIPQPCVPIDQWPRRPMLVPARVGRIPEEPPKPCPPRPCGVPRAPSGTWTSPVDSPHVGQDSSEDWEICERVPVAAPVVSGGERFGGLVARLRARGVRDPHALAAWIGRRKYGAERFAQMAAAGRR